MKILLRGVIAALSLLLLVPLVVVLLLDEAHYKQQISSAVEAKTGRPLLIEGDLKLAFGIKPRISAESVRYPNAPWAEQPWAITVQRAVFAVDPWALLRGRLLVEDIALHSPRMWVEKNASGVYNITIDPALRRTGRATSMPSWLDLSAAEILNGEITVTTRRRQWDIRIHHANAESAGRDEPVAVDFRGEVEQTPITARATLGSLETLFAQQPSELSADGQVGGEGNRMRVNGKVGNLLRWREADLWLDLEVAHTDELSALANIELADIGPVNGRVRFRQTRGVAGISLPWIELTATHFGVHSTLVGEIAKPYRREGIDLRLSMAGMFDPVLPPSLDSLAIASPLEVGLKATLRGSARDFDFSIESAKAENAELSLAAQGTLELLQGAWRGALPVSLTIGNIGALTPSGDSQSGAEPIQAEAELVRDQGAWNLHNVKLSLAGETLTIKAAGAINRLLAEPAGHLYVIAEAADGSHLQPWFDNPLPPITELQLEAAIAFRPGTLRADVDKLAGRMYGVDLSAAGVVEELHRWRGVDLAVTGRAAGLHRLPTPTSRKFPRTEPLNLRARLVDGESGKFDLTDIVASLTDPLLELEAQGEVRGLGASMRARLDVDLRLASATPLRPFFGAPQWAEAVEATLPVQSSATLYSLAARNWGMRNLEVRSLADDVEAALSGKIDQFAPLIGQFHPKIARLPVSRIPPRWDIPRPAGGQLELSLDMLAEPDGFRFDNIVAEIASDDAQLGLRGDIERLGATTAGSARVEFEAADVAALGWSRLDSLNPEKPVSGTLAITFGADAQHGHPTLGVDIDSIALGASDLRGTLDWAWLAANAEGDRGVPRVHGKLFSERLDLREILAPTPKENRFFSAVPINTGWIHKADGHIDLSAGALSNRVVDLRYATVGMLLQGGILTQRIAGRMGQGDLNATLTIDANAQPLSAEFMMNGKQLDTAGLVSFRNGDYLDGGTFDADMDFVATGNSLADLMASADGSTFLRLHGARMKNQSLETIGGDIFSTIISAVNPARSVGEYVDIECGIIRVKIDQGVATTEDGLAMKTDKVTLLGGGNIDLRDESLQILIVPKARKGLGVNLFSLAKVVRLGGSLAAPRIEADASRLLQSGATVWAALSTGGLSLIAQGLFDRVHANTDVCRLAHAGGGGGSGEVGLSDLEVRLDSEE